MGTELSGAHCYEGKEQVTHYILVLPFFFPFFSFYFISPVLVVWDRDYLSLYIRWLGSTLVSMLDSLYTLVR